MMPILILAVFFGLYFIGTRHQFWAMFWAWMVLVVGTVGLEEEPSDLHVIGALSCCVAVWLFSGLKEGEKIFKFPDFSDTRTIKKTSTTQDFTEKIAIAIVTADLLARKRVNKDDVIRALLFTGPGKWVGPHRKYHIALEIIGEDDVLHFVITQWKDGSVRVSPEFVEDDDDDDSEAQAIIDEILGKE